MNIPEQEPYSLPESLAKELESRGAALIETSDITNIGRLVEPNGSDRLNTNNDPIERLINSDKKRFDALEAAKNGNFDGITDKAEKALLEERLQREGQKGLESIEKALKNEFIKAPVDPEQLGHYVAEQQFGTSANGTL